ncbi:mechanosensitive ion channel domain-containing protein [Emcibacter sp. SYSU 3D8]|uniref:mechanosensitive ion channel family protein n=1 Tax=Emcibacter sp. SYSU 3D8 TaxID=3133969 RepID=UPI0031FEF316
MPELFDNLADSQGFGWVPFWLIASAVAVVVAASALALHGALLRRIDRHPGQIFTAQALRRTRGVVRLGIPVLVAALLSRFLEVSPAVETLIDRVGVLALLFLLGWTLLILCDLSADLYLRRYRLDVADNLHARKMVTQVRILKRTAKTLVVVVFLALMLMTFDTARQFGVSLMASAGAAGLILGLAARPVLSNLIAGIQIAITQPIRVDDAVVVEGEWGWIEEINSSFVVIKLWDWRRLVVPLGYFIEKPFQNWTRTTASIIGTVYLYVDYTVPVERVRQKLDKVARESELWDGQVVNLQVTEGTENAMQLRALVSASTSPRAWDLRCEVREKMIDFLQREFPQALPRHRVDLTADGPPPAGG